MDSHARLSVGLIVSLQKIFVKHVTAAGCFSAFCNLFSVCVDAHS